MSKDFIEEMPITKKGVCPYKIRFETKTKIFMLECSDDIYSNVKAILNNEKVTIYEVYLWGIYKFIKDCLDESRPISTSF